jgi:hypothetical protein
VVILASPQTLQTPGRTASRMGRSAAKPSCAQLPRSVASFRYLAEAARSLLEPLLHRHRLRFARIDAPRLRSDDPCLGQPRPQFRLQRNRSAGPQRRRTCRASQAHQLKIDRASPSAAPSVRSGSDRPQDNFGARLDPPAPQSAERIKGFRFYCRNCRHYGEAATEGINRGWYGRF